MKKHWCPSNPPKTLLAPWATRPVANNPGQSWYRPLRLCPRRCLRSGCCCLNLQDFPRPPYGHGLTPPWPSSCPRHPLLLGPQLHQFGTSCTGDSGGRSRPLPVQNFTPKLPALEHHPPLTRRPRNHHRSFVSLIRSHQLMRYHPGKILGVA